jgi:phosphoserine phosphatase
VKLLVLDIEGTLFRTDVSMPERSTDSAMWRRITRTLGPNAVEEEIATHVRSREGQYRGYLDWMKDTISIHQRQGLTADVFASLIKSAEYNPGVEQTLLAVDRERFEILLVSGGFRELAARVQADFKVRHAFAACEYIFGRDGSLTAYNLLPCDFVGKIEFVRLMLREYGLTPQDWLFVGDGPNDVPIAKAAPISVAYSACPELQAVATYRTDFFPDLLDILRENGL